MTNHRSSYFIKLVFISVLSWALVSSIAVAQQGDDWEDWDDWGEQSQVKPYSFQGFVEAARGQFTDGNDVVGRAQSLSELRGRLEYRYEAEKVTFQMIGDLVHDDVLNDSKWQTREFNLQTSLTDNLDIKIGRQILTWGTGEYLFLNDMFAKDWQSFFAGREDEYLKAPQDSVRLSWYGNLFNRDWVIEGVWTPEFQSDTFITGERFSFFSSQMGDHIAPAEYFNYQNRGDDQYGFRAKTSFGSSELALYGYVGYWMTPSGQKIDSSDEMLAYFPRLNVWGASIVTPLAVGVFNAEAAWYDSRESHNGLNANVPHSQLRLLTGYSQEVATDFTLAAQYYVEKTQNYDRLKANISGLDGEFTVDEYRHLLTVRATYLTHMQKFIWSLFSFYSPSDEDFYLRPSLIYRQDDNWQYAVGGNLFGGDQQHTFFGQHEDNSNVYMRIRYSF